MYHCLSSLLLFGLIPIFLFSCKKDPKAPINNGTSGPMIQDPAYEITAADFNYPVGKMWIYAVSAATFVANFDNPNDPFTNYTHTASDTYTVKVVSDSTNGALRYCYYKYFFSNGQSGIIQTSYTDTINSNYHIIIDGSIGATVFGPAAMSISLPLRDTSKWNNLYYPSMSNINECQSLGFENLYSPFYLKCLKWEKKYYPGDGFTKTFWFHKKHGLIKQMSEDYYSINNGNSVTIKTSTTSLISVH